MHDRHLCAAVYCHAVSCVLRNAKECSKVFDHSIRMLSLMAVSRSNEFGFHKSPSAQPGSQTRTGRENFEVCSTVLLMLSEGFQIGLADFKSGNAMFEGVQSWQNVESVIGGVPTLLDDRIMCLFMSLERKRWQGSVSMNLFTPMRYQVGLRKDAVSIELVGNISVIGGMMQPGVHYPSIFGQHLSFSIYFLICLFLLHKFHFQGISFCLCLFAGSPEYC